MRNETLTVRAYRIDAKLRNLERRDQGVHDEVVRQWNLSVPLVRVIAAGFVVALSKEGRDALSELEAEVDVTLAALKAGA